MTEKKVLQGYAYAKEVFGELGVDVDAAIAVADQVPISMHCWQGDDLIGYDGVGELTGGGCRRFPFGKWRLLTWETENSKQIR